MEVAITTIYKWGCRKRCRPAVTGDAVSPYLESARIEKKIPGRISRSSPSGTGNGNNYLNIPKKN
jgi:hypothetical protein